MCGISGILTRSQTIDDLALDKDKLSLILNHRGPDFNDHIITNDRKKIFFFNRLKIIDLSDKSNQPISSKEKIILFNGELYNFKELSLKYFPEDSSESDTIFLSKLIDSKDIHQILKEIRGMYSIAIYNRETDFLDLFRDYFGVKPLFYFINQEIFIFSSEIKFILNFLNLSNFEHSPSQYFELGYNLKDGTIYKNIFSLEKNVNLNLNLNTWQINKKNLHNLELSKKIYLNTNTIFNNLKQNIRNSIERNLVSDRPITVLQSSGLDSNLIISEMQKHLGNIESYTIEFQESDFDESKEIRTMNKKNNVKSNFVKFSSIDFLEIFQKYNTYFDQPFFDPSSFPLLRLFEQIKTKYDVAISGDGGDEMLLGYNRYFLKKNRILNFILKSNLINKDLSIYLVKTLLKSLGYKNADYKANKLINFYFEKNKFKSIYQNINSPNLKKTIYSFENDGKLGELIDFDFNNYLPNNILYKSDLVSMARSVEVRVPFLDEDILRDIIILKNKINKKSLLHEMLKENKYYYPNIPKRGFDVPLNSWVESILNNYSIPNLNYHDIDKSFHYDYFVNQINKKHSGFEKNYLFLFNRLIYLKWRNII